MVDYLKETALKQPEELESEQTFQVPSLNAEDKSLPGGASTGVVSLLAQTLGIDGIRMT